MDDALGPNSPIESPASPMRPATPQRGPGRATQTDRNLRDAPVGSPEALRTHWREQLQAHKRLSRLGRNISDSPKMEISREGFYEC